MSTSANLPNLYENKENIQENVNIPRINKITADDMNIIKQLLENSVYIDNESLKDINNNAFDPIIPRYKKLSDNVNFEISKSGDWTVKKYDNGYIEMYHKFTGYYTLNNSYGSAYWTEIKDKAFPIKLTELTSIHTDVLCSGHILTTTYSQLTNLKYSIFVADLSQSLTNQQMTFYTTVAGKWK